MRALLVHSAVLLLSLQVALGTRVQTASRTAIAGVVLRAGTDEPVSGAEVIANWVIRPSGTRLPVPRSTTDSAGKFDLAKESNSPSSLARAREHSRFQSPQDLIGAMEPLNCKTFFLGITGYPPWLNRR